MKRKPPLRRILALIAFASLAILGIWMGGRPEFAIPAQAVRPWVEERWQKQTADRSQAEASLTEAEFFTGYTHLKTDLPPRYQRLEPDDTQAPLQLRALGVGGHQFTRKGDPPSFRFYDAATGRRLETPPRPSVFASGGTYGPFQVEMHFDAPSPVRVDSVWFFDRRTHQALGGPFGPRAQGAGFQAVGAAVYTLRPSGVIAVVDGSIPGDTVLGKLEARKEAMLSAGDLTLKVMDATAGKQSPPPGRSQIGVSRPEITLTVMIYPWGHRSGLRFLAVGPAGEKIPTTTSRIENAGVMIKCPVTPEKISHLEILGPARHFRQIVELPKLTDLPPGNDRVSNLLDLRIPRLYLKSGEAARALAVYGQVKLNGWEVTYLNDPMHSTSFATCENITLGQLCQIAEAEAGNGQHLVFDPAEMNLRFVQPKPGPPWMDWLGQWFD